MSRRETDHQKRKIYSWSYSRHSRSFAANARVFPCIFFASFAPFAVKDFYGPFFPGIPPFKSEVQWAELLNGGRGMIEVMVASNSPVVREGLKSILGGFPEMAVCFLEYGWQALPAPVFDRGVDVLIVDLAAAGSGSEF